MEEIILIKKSLYKLQISNLHLIETVRSFILENKEKFTDRSWDCNIHTSKNKFKNILYEVEEFKYIKNTLEEEIKNFLKKPFMLCESWINILNENGYQEFHNHEEKKETRKIGSGCLYFTKENSKIEFIFFQESVRHQEIPKEGEILLFDSNVYHRVVDSKKERISLAFNFIY